MWPHKHGLGPRLGYGVDGAGYVLVVSPGHSDTRLGDPQFNCARLQKQPQAFMPASAPVQFGPSTSRVNLLTPNSAAKLTQAALAINESLSSYIPPELCRPLLLESAALDSELVTDPSQGDLFAVSYGGERKRVPRRLDYMAYAGGPHQSVLYVSRMARQYLPNLFDCGDAEAEAEAIIGAFDFKDTIKQVLFMPIDPPVLRCLIVRTSFKVVVLFIKSDSDSQQSVIPIKTITGADFFDHELADVAFDPNNEAYFAVVDVTGTIRMWKILGELFLVVVAPRVASIILTYEPASLSRWRRLVWIGDHMLVFSRNRVVQHSNTYVKPGVASFLTCDTKTILSAEVWVHLMDVQVVDKQIFLLTSKELIWCRVEKGKFERMLSWKHSLNSGDTTARLDATSLPRSNEYVCLIRSRISPLALVLTFGVQSGRQVMLCDPYTIFASSNYDELLKTHIAWPDTKPSPRIHPKVNTGTEKVDGRYFGFYALHKYVGMTKCVATRSPENLRTERQLKSPLGGSTGSVERKLQPPQKSVADYTYRCRRRNLLDQIKSIHEELTQIPQDQSEYIQEYALQLGEGLSGAGRSSSIFTLADFTKHLSTNISDTRDFCDMLEQLSIFSVAAGVSLNLESLHFLFEVDATEISDYLVLIEKQLIKINASYPNGDLFNHPINCGITAMSLGLSLTSGTSEDATPTLKSTFQHTLESCGERVRALIDEWDDTSDVDKPVERSTVFQDSTSMPKIKLAESIDLKQSTSSQKRRPKHSRQYSAPSHTSESLRSIPSSQQLVAQLQSTQGPSQADSTVGMLLLSHHSSSQMKGASQKRSHSQLSQGGASQKKKPKRKGGFA